jgi:hypothetical protein
MPTNTDDHEEFILRFLEVLGLTDDEQQRQQPHPAECANARDGATDTETEFSDEDLEVMANYVKQRQQLHPAEYDRKALTDYILAGIRIQRARFISEGPHVLDDGHYLPEITESMLAKYFPLFYADLLAEKSNIDDLNPLNPDDPYYIEHICYRAAARNALRGLRRLSDGSKLHFDKQWGITELNQFAADHKRLVMRGQEVWSTLCHEYGHAVFFQFADILETGKANKNIITVYKYGGGKSMTLSKRKLKSEFLDALLTLAGIAAARFSAKGYRIFSCEEITLENGKRASDDIERASCLLQLSGVAAKKVNEALETITSVLEVFFALMHVFNFYDWQSHLLANDDPTLKYFDEPLHTGFVVHIMPDHYKSFFEYEPERALAPAKAPQSKATKESILRFINLRQLAIDVGVTKITF